MLVSIIFRLWTSLWCLRMNNCALNPLWLSSCLGFLCTVSLISFLGLFGKNLFFFYYSALQLNLVDAWVLFSHLCLSLFSPWQFYIPFCSLASKVLSWPLHLHFYPNLILIVMVSPFLLALVLCFSSVFWSHLSPSSCYRSDDFPGLASYSVFLPFLIGWSVFHVTRHNNVFFSPPCSSTLSHNPLPAWSLHSSGVPRFLPVT